MDGTQRDLAEALAAIEEVMGCDKGQSEPEWIEWCNRYLPLIQRQGLMPGAIDFA